MNRSLTLLRAFQYRILPIQYSFIKMIYGKASCFAFSAIMHIELHNPTFTQDLFLCEISSISILELFLPQISLKVIRRNIDQRVGA